jgi:hypothetical protein
MGHDRGAKDCGDAHASARSLAGSPIDSEVDA